MAIKWKNPLFMYSPQINPPGYKTCALTNNWIDDIGFHGSSSFHELQLGDHFDLVVESCRVGLRKPDKSIYQLACELLQVEPKQVV